MEIGSQVKRRASGSKSEQEISRSSRPAVFVVVVSTRVAP